MTPIPSEPLVNTKWERFAQSVAMGVGPSESYVRIYEIVNKRNAQSRAAKLIKRVQVEARVVYLTKARLEGKLESGVDLKSVIKTCQEVIETSASTGQRLKAVEVLNKLGVFDNETKDDGKRMDPSAICEYLARFAGAPAKELARIPGGLRGLVVGLMELTGASVADMMKVFGEIKDEITNQMTDNITLCLFPSPVKAKPSEASESGEKIQILGPFSASSDKLDFENEVDDETLVETITAPVEVEEMSAEMRERLGPALELAKQLKGENDSGPDQGPGAVYNF